MQHSLIIFTALFAALTRAQGADKTLKANVIQSASAQTGQDGKIEEGQVASLTSTDNFINFCSGKTLTNGEQVEIGSCNSIPMGEIPAKNTMVSALILFPEAAGKPITPDQTFDIKVQMENLVLGSFTNPKNTYYSAPQQLQNGQIVGHVHVTVQNLGGSMNPTKPPDAAQFNFFKGINVPGSNGLVAATVTGGLPAGFYRACTLASSSNHQPVIMPVAQRGAQDDCVRFEVGGQGNNNANNNNNANQNQAANAQGAKEGEKNQATAAAQGAKEGEEANKNQAGAKAQGAKEGQNDEKNQAAAKAQGAKEGENDEKNQVTAAAQGAKEGEEANKNQAGAKAQGAKEGQNDEKNQAAAKAQGAKEGENDEKNQATAAAQGAKEGQGASKNQQNSEKGEEKEDEDEDNQNEKQKAAEKDNDKRRKRFISSRIFVS